MSTREGQNILFKKYLENIFGNVRSIEEDTENLILEAIPSVSYSSYGQHTNIYGDQDIFKSQTQKYIATVNYLFDEGYNPTLAELILYAGIERYKTSVLQKNPMPYMGYWKMPGEKGIFMIDYLSKYRYIDCVDFLWRFLDTDLPTNEKVIFEGSLCLVELTDNNPVIYHYTEDDKIFSRLTFALDKEGCNNMENAVVCGNYMSAAGDKEFYLLIDSIYQKCLLSKNLEDIARLHFYLCRRVSHFRGGGAIAEWISSSLLIHADYDFKGWSTDPHLEAWAQAITSGIDRFIEIYLKIANL